MIAELISVGTELLLGNIVNTNAAYLSKQCATLGLSVYYQTTVGDNEVRLQEALKQALGRADLVILTGGLGPTQDDLTKEVVAKTIGETLVTDIRTKEYIVQYFKNKGINQIPENNMRQAQIIDGSTVFDNEWGTAPGLIIVTKKGKRIILLPGPPNEMEPMFEKYIIPYVMNITGNTIYSGVVKLCGIPESQVEMMILDLIEAQTNPTIATYANCGEVHIRVTAKAKDEEEAKSLVNPIVTELKLRFKDAVYTTEEEETLEDVVVKLLQKHELTVVTAESCTGGMVASRIVNVAGASNVLKESFITYSNKAKRKYLDVNKETLKKYTAVSEKTAKEMAKGAALNTDCDTSISITGLAGPDGGTDETPVGTVFIGCYVKDKTVVERHQFQGNRLKVRQQATTFALDLLRRCVIAQYD